MPKQPGTLKREKRFVEKHRKNRTEFLASCEADGRAFLDAWSAGLNSTPDSALGLRFAGATHRVKTWLSTRGTCRILDGDFGGWEDLRDEIDLRYWTAQVFEERYRRGEPGTWGVLEVGVPDFCYAALALHLGREKAAETILARQVRYGNERPDDKCHPNNWRLSSGALLFMIRLYELWTGCRVPIREDRLPSLDRYAQLLDPRCSGELLAADIDWACVEHMEQADKNSDFPPFRLPPFPLIPIEVILWLKLRRREGLEHGTFGHPLLETPLAALDVPSSAKDPSPVRTVLEKAIPHLKAYLDG